MGKNRRNFIFIASFLTGLVASKNTHVDELPETLTNATSKTDQGYFLMDVVWKLPAGAIIENTEIVKKYETNSDALKRINQSFKSVKRIVSIESTISESTILFQYKFKTKLDFIVWDLLRRKAGHGVKDTIVVKNSKTYKGAKRLVINEVIS